MYGELGEVVIERRSIKHIDAGEETLSEMEYVSDYLGRMNKITYPDGEVVTYGYDYGGQVESVIGVYDGTTTRYVEDIGYDEYSQRVFIHYGNGVKTEYTYDEERRWLDKIITTNERSDVYQNIDYSFDSVGNVLKYTNVSLNYTTSQNYDYDDLYQLIRANGTSSDTSYGINHYTSEYNQSYDFDLMGNMLNKKSMSSVQPAQTVGDDLNYELQYIYDEEYAHRVKQIGNMYYEYDANGNVVLEREGEIREGGETERLFEIEDEAENVYSSDYGWAFGN